MPAEFGDTPWGRAWVRTVESTSVTAPNPLLPRARSLARNHAVTILTIETGRVEADVVVRGVTHRVRFELPLWSIEAQAEAETLIAKALADNRGAAAGDLPDSLEEELNRHHINVAVPLDEQSADCTCPARQRPCVHVLATVYTLAQRIDEQPTLAVDLRSTATKPATQRDPDWIELADIDVRGFYGT